MARDRVVQMVPSQGRTGLGRVLERGSLPTANPAYVVVGGRAIKYVVGRRAPKYVVQPYYRYADMQPFYRSHCGLRRFQPGV
eukprot:2060657-Alexandrium_andersonii.AAC.1